MEVTIKRAGLPEIQPLRNLFLAEIKFQFIYNKCHAAGWADVYVFIHEGMEIGYGSLWGKEKRDLRDTIFEFFLVTSFGKYAREIFIQFMNISGAGFIQCQTNYLFLAQMLFEHAHNINAEAILFEDDFETHIDIPGVIFRKEEKPDGDTEYLLIHGDKIVATGGYVWNYNFPYIDIYYGVEEGERRKGYGSLITQELKKEAYRLKRIPSARCNIKNAASRATLLKAGMRICGYMLEGSLEKI